MLPGKGDVDSYDAMLPYLEYGHRVFTNNVASTFLCIMRVKERVRYAGNIGEVVSGEEAYPAFLFLFRHVWSVPGSHSAVCGCSRMDEGPPYRAFSDKASARKDAQAARRWCRPTPSRGGGSHGCASVLWLLWRRRVDS